MSIAQKTTINVLDIEGKAVAILPNAKMATRLPEKKFEGTRIENPEEESLNRKWARWGNSDNLPTKVRRKFKTVPIAGIAIERLIAMMFGNGIAYYRNADLAKGNKIERAFIPEVEAFLKRNRINTAWLPGQFADYRYYMNCFSELIFSLDKREIIGIHHKPAEHCRVATHNPGTKRSETLFYSPDFGLGNEPQEIRTLQIPLISLYDYYFDEENYTKRFKNKFAWHSYFPTPGHFYYADAFWAGLFVENGWIDVSAKVPQVVNAMMNNQVVLKYQILIPETYFEVRFQEWQTYTDEQRNKFINDLIDEINDTLSGTDNWFKSITTLFKQDPNTGAELGKIEIIAIDDKVKDDKWVPSSEKSDAQIVQGLGLHPSQVGLAPEGGKMGAGSGSDQREAYNTAINTNTIHQNIVLEPLNFIAQYNALINPGVWDITFFIDHTVHTTTNNQESGMQPSDTSIEVR
jgi:hypothetical protein